MIQYKGDDLWQEMAFVAEKATTSGHLETIDSSLEPLSIGSMTFVVRYAPNLTTKASISTSPKRKHPFCPPEPELFVKALGDAHNLILNKFNVLPMHGLITTRQWVAQTDQLTLSDFTALALVLDEVDGLIFYNGGQQAGASQDHRHFQLVPKDLGLGELPIESLINDLQCGKIDTLYPFKYRYYTLPNYRAESLYDAWQKMEFSWQPYNLLITRSWLLVIPRVCESAGTISINSLGFAGALLAKSQAELDFIHQHGPIGVLNLVCSSE